MPLTYEKLNDLVTDALDHARDNDYRPGETDDDMLSNGISEAATAADLELTPDDELQAVQILRERLDELDEDHGVTAHDIAYMP
jgi:hypothetical protein